MAVRVSKMTVSVDDVDLYDYEFKGLSSDTKPTANVDTNSLFLELDTGDFYYYDGSVWAKLGAGGGNMPAGELLYEGTLSNGRTVGNGYIYELNDVALNYSSIIVEYNGTQYTVNNYSEDEGIFSFGGTFDYNEGSFDFSEYPFNCSYMGGNELSMYKSQDENPTIKIWANSDPVEISGEIDIPTPIAPDIG